MTAPIKVLLADDQTLVRRSLARVLHESEFISVVAEVANADENDGLQAVGTEQIDDHHGQLLDIVAQAARAELAEVSQVLAQLGGFDAGGLGQRLA